nr:hypothetical protein REQ54_03625 [Rhizobium sp. Q54]
MTALVRLENAAIAFMALATYWYLDAGWWLFLLLVLVPDLAMLGYLFGSRSGAICYNALHSFIGVGLLLVSGYLLGWDPAAPLALIWIFHIGFDRALGYGLKHQSGFKDTHLGRIG